MLIGALSRSSLPSQDLDLKNQQPVISPAVRFNSRIVSDVATERILFRGLEQGVTKDIEAKAHKTAVTQLRKDKLNLLVYSDGSQRKLPDGSLATGAGAVVYHGDREVFTAREHLPVGGTPTIHDAEMRGVEIGSLAAISYAMTHRPPLRCIYLFVDNQEVLRNIRFPPSNPRKRPSTTSRMAVIEFLESHEQNRLEIWWTPSHSGIVGNERADRLAKEATRLS